MKSITLCILIFLVGYIATSCISKYKKNDSTYMDKFNLVLQLMAENKDIKNIDSVVPRWSESDDWQSFKQKFEVHFEEVITSLAKNNGSAELGGAYSLFMNVLNSQEKYSKDQNKFYEELDLVSDLILNN